MIWSKIRIHNLKRNLLKFGNHKLGDDTAIFNMSPAKTCPSRKLGLCTVVKKGWRCYAEKAETQYPKTVPNYRKAQEAYWKSTPVMRIIEDFHRKIRDRKKTTRYLRFNEAGDFHDQCDVDKLSVIADSLRPFGITTYGYTARSDLDFSNARFLVKGSGLARLNKSTGRTVVIGKKEGPPTTENETWIVCPGNCRKCDVCKKNLDVSVAFRKH